MYVRVGKPPPIFIDNMSMVLNETNIGISFNKKTVALSYHFVREHVANDVVEVRTIYTKEHYVDPFTKVLVSNEFNGFYLEQMVNG